MTASKHVHALSLVLEYERIDEREEKQLFFIVWCDGQVKRRERRIVRVDIYCMHSVDVYCTVCYLIVCILIILCAIQNPPNKI